MRSYLLPIVLALLLHAVAIAALTIGFEPEASERRIIKPEIVTSKLIVLQPKAQPKPRATPPQPKPIVTPPPQATEAPKPDPLAAQREADRKRAAEEAEAKRKVAEEIERQRRLAELAATSFDDALAEEVSNLEEATADEVAASYRQLIYQRIVANWSRPPSARNGMETLLQVELVPTGSVVGVSVIESSGNAAFDRSAEAAVRKARKFDVPDESAAFERNFRRFTVLFRPEDLLR